MENTLRVITKIEKTHKNLGLPTMFLKLIDLSDMGCFIVADRGRGKTTVLRCEELMRHRDVIKLSIVTWAGIAKMAEKFSGQSLTVLNMDFSSFYTDYLKDVAVSLISNLLTEHFVHATTGRYEIKIEDCYMSFMSATQPQLLRKLSRLPTWESMYRDRFIRFFMLYPFGSPAYTKEEPQVPNSLIIGEAAKDVLSVMIPNSIKGTSGYERLKGIIQRQTSEGRCEMWLDRLLRAHAYFNNRDTVADKDVTFLELFAPYLTLDMLLSERRGVASPLVLDADAFVIFDYLVERGSASRAAMREHFRVSQHTIVKNMDLLMARNLVRGTYGKDEYRVNPTWYTRYMMPIIKWGQEVGIAK